MIIKEKAPRPMFECYILLNVVYVYKSEATLSLHKKIQPFMYIKAVFVM